MPNDSAAPNRGPRFPLGGPVPFEYSLCASSASPRRKVRRSVRAVMRARRDTGRDSTPKQLAEARRIAALPAYVQRRHPSAVPADQTRLDHINTYGSLPEFYIDRTFRCRDCGKEEIWRAADQKWYYEVAKGHVDATAVRCHDCRKKRKAKK